MIRPFKLTPAFKDYIWGGKKLKSKYGKASDLPKLAESWELSCHPDGESIIADGDFKGMTFSQFLKSQNQPPVPILIKLIDTDEDLSVQVHPDNEYARVHENDSGKTEMWIVLECETGAYVRLGFNRDISKEAFINRLKGYEITDVLRKVKVRKGDVMFIPAGTVHSIGKGVVLVEIQQCSNATYRIDDFERLGSDGNLRPLHIEKALDVIDFTLYKEKPVGAGILSSSKEYIHMRLVACDYFCTDRLELKGSFLFSCENKNFVCVLCVDGSVTIESESGTLALSKGETAFIPSGHKNVSFKGQGQVIIVYEG